MQNVSKDVCNISKYIMTDCKLEDYKTRETLTRRSIPKRYLDPNSFCNNVYRNKAQVAIAQKSKHVSERHGTGVIDAGRTTVVHNGILYFVCEK